MSILGSLISRMIWFVTSAELHCSEANKQLTMALKTWLIVISIWPIEMAATIFDKDEISEIWVTFPDPHLRKAKAQKRLTSDRFIDLYRKFVKKGSIIQLKTDEPNLYEFTVETAEANPFVHLLEHYDDIYSLDELPQADLDIKTYYEAMHLENKKTIKYVKTQLK